MRSAGERQAVRRSVGDRVAAQRWVRGAIVRIPLGENRFGAAQMLDLPEYAFFDTQASGDLTAAEIVQRPVLFRIWVHRKSYSQGRWQKIGTAPVSEVLDQPVERFNQDPLAPSQIAIHFGRQVRPGTPEECEALERAAVWEPEHVEDRLRDHYANRPNKWVESLRFRWQA